METKPEKKAIKIVALRSEAGNDVMWPAIVNMQIDGMYRWIYLVGL